MTSTGFALLAALAAAVGTASLTASSRRVGARRTAALTGLYGIVIGPVAALAVEGHPHASAASWSWALAAGSLSLVGNGLFFVAAQRLEMAILAPIIASAGGVSGCLAIAFGAPWSRLTLVGGTLVTFGVVLSALAPRGRGPRGSRWTGVLLGAASALALAGSYVAIGQSEEHVGAAWAYVVLMVLTFALWTLPTLARRQQLPLAQAGRLILLSETSGVCVFVFLGRASAQDPVLAGLVYSQYAVLAAAFGLVFWRERPLKRNWLGAALAVGGTVILLTH